MSLQDLVTYLTDGPLKTATDALADLETRRVTEEAAVASARSAQAVAQQKSQQLATEERALRAALAVATSPAVDSLARSLKANLLQQRKAAAALRLAEDGVAQALQDRADASLRRTELGRRVASLTAERAAWTARRDTLKTANEAATAARQTLAGAGSLTGAVTAARSAIVAVLSSNPANADLCLSMFEERAKAAEADQRRLPATIRSDRAVLAGLGDAESLGAIVDTAIDGATSFGPAVERARSVLVQLRDGAPSLVAANERDALNAAASAMAIADANGATPVGLDKRVSTAALDLTAAKIRQAGVATEVDLGTKTPTDLDSANDAVDLAKTAVADARALAAATIPAEAIDAFEMAVPPPLMDAVVAFARSSVSATQIGATTVPFSVDAEVTAYLARRTVLDTEEAKRERLALRFRRSLADAAAAASSGAAAVISTVRGDA